MEPGVVEWVCCFGRWVDRERSTGRGAGGDGAGDRRWRAVPGREVAVPVRRSVRRGAAMTEHAVVLAGGGPTGLMLLASFQRRRCHRRTTHPTTRSTGREPVVCHPEL